MDTLQALEAIKRARDAGDLDAEIQAMEAYKASYAQKAEKPDLNVGDWLRMAIGQGAAFNLGDEIEAGVRAPFSDRTYGEIRDEIRGQNKRIESEYPVSSFAANVAGGMLTGGAGLAALKTIPRFAQMGRVAQLATAGSGSGAVAGAGAGEDLASRSLGALVGAPLGGALGFAGGKLERALPGTAQHQEAVKQLGRADLGAEVAKLNEGAPVAWATGVDVDPMLAKAAMDARPTNLDAFTDRFKARQRLQGPILEDTIKGVGQSPQSRAEALSALMQNRRESANALYDPLRGESVTLNADLASTIATKEGKDAAKRTLNAMREQTQNPSLKLNEAAQSFDFWHGFQQVLRDKAEKFGVSEKPLSGVEAAAMRTKRDRVMASMFGEEWGPQYKEATKQFRTDSAIIDALKDSEKFMRLDRDVFKTAVGKLKPDEREAFASGVLSDLVEKSMRSPDTANMARNVIKTPALRFKLETLLGPEKYGQIEKQLSNLSLMTETHGKLFANSNTAEKLALQEIMAGGQQEGGVLRNLAMWEPRSAMRSLIGQPKPKVLDPKVAGSILDVLSQQTPAQFAQEMARLRAGGAPTGYAIPGLIGGAASGLTGAWQGNR